MNDEKKDLIMGITTVTFGLLPLYPASGKGSLVLFSAGFLILFLMSFLFKRVKNFKEYAVIYAVAAVFVVSYPIVLALLCIFFAPFTKFYYIVTGLILAVLLIIDVRIFLFRKTAGKKTKNILLSAALCSVFIWETAAVLITDAVSVLFSVRAGMLFFFPIVFSFAFTIVIMFLGNVLRKLIKKSKKEDNEDEGLKFVLGGMTLFAVWLFLVTAPISIFDIRTTGDAVSPDEKSEIENKEPDLFQAIEKDDADAIKALSDKINVPDENGWTPLMHAAVKGNEDTVKLLITGGADVNADMDGITAMKIAIMFNRPENAQILADAGAVIQPLTDMPLWLSAWMNPARPWNDFRIFGFFRKNKVPFFKTLPGYYRAMLDERRKGFRERMKWQSDG